MVPSWRRCKTEVGINYMALVLISKIAPSKFLEITYSAFALLLDPEQIERFLI